MRGKPADLATPRSIFPRKAIRNKAFGALSFIHFPYARLSVVILHALASKMPCSEVTDAVSPQKRCKSDAVNGHEELKVLKFAKLTENATTPSRGSNRAAGFDLYR